jgi:hypothetical protein
VAKARVRVSGLRQKNGRVHAFLFQDVSTNDATMSAKIFGSLKHNLNTVSMEEDPKGFQLTVEAHPRNPRGRHLNEFLFL